MVTFEEQYASALVRLPTIKPEDKGPNIEYNDGISTEELDRLRKESTNRINARKRREAEKQQMVQKRNERYGIHNPAPVNDEKAPDFENQLSHAFQIKYKRADALGVRNLVIDEHNLVRASRPNMDKLHKIENLKHEIRDPKPKIVEKELSMSATQISTQEDPFKKFEDLAQESKEKKIVDKSSSKAIKRPKIKER